MGTGAGLVFRIQAFFAGRREPVPIFSKPSQGKPADESEDAAARQTCDVIRGSYLRRDLLHEKWLSALETGKSMFPGVDELIGERRDGAGRDAHERVGGT